MILAITNQKGGVGKTTLSLNLSSALAFLGYRVLLIDMDPQGNASDGLGIDTEQLNQTTYDVLINNVPLCETVISHKIKNLFVVPTNIGLFGAEAELSSENTRPFRLRQALKMEKEKYDFILIDCPPNLGVLTVNALLASTDLLVPIEPNSYALKGLSVLLNTLLKINEDLEHFTNLLGIAINMYETNNQLHQAIIENISESFPDDKIFKTKVHRDPLIAEAEIHGQSVVEYRPCSVPSSMFVNLAEEIIKKNNERKQTRQTETTRQSRKISH